MKAQGLPITTIILAIIAIFVLVIVIYLAGSKLGQFGANVDSCSQKGGVCSQTLPGNSCGGNTPIRFIGTECEKTSPDNHCCIPLGV